MITRDDLVLIGQHLGTQGLFEISCKLLAVAEAAKEMLEDEFGPEATGRLADALKALEAP